MMQLELKTRASGGISEWVQHTNGLAIFHQDFFHLGSAKALTPTPANRCALQSRNAPVTLWARNPATVEEINTRHSNETYLPGARLPDKLLATNDIGQCQAFVVVPLPNVSDNCMGSASYTNQITGTTDASGIYDFTGLMPLVYKAQHSLLDGLQIGFVWDFLIIVAVMILLCRAASAGLRGCRAAVPVSGLGSASRTRSPAGCGSTAATWPTSARSPRAPTGRATTSAR